MKNLYLKKWYVKSQLVIVKMADIHMDTTQVETNNCLLVGQSEKAIKVTIINYDGKTVKNSWIPKAALVVCESEEEYQELNKVENKELALNQVQDFMKNYKFNGLENIENAKAYVSMYC